MHWKLKAAAFRLLDWPGGQSAHYFLQRHVTRTWPRPARTLDALWDVAANVIGDYKSHCAGTPPGSVLELGAGRDLAVPLALRAMGVRVVYSVDVSRLARLPLIRHAAAHMARKARSPAPRLESWKDLERLNIIYRAPVRDDDWSAEVDCSCSNEVLEHVPRVELGAALRGLRRATRTGGLAIHRIDYSDHYARSDKRISRLNFLKFADEQWSKYNSGMQHVNRLRHSDYVRLFRQAGFTVIDESFVPGDVPDDIRTSLAPQFVSYAPEDLYAVSGRIIAKTSPA